MEFIVIAVLGTVGAGLTAGGFVLYRKSMKNHMKVLGASAMASGFVMLALVLWITPLSRVTG
jgi:hypothetical protein